MNIEHKIRYSHGINKTHTNSVNIAGGVWNLVPRHSPATISWIPIYRVHDSQCLLYKFGFTIKMTYEAFSPFCRSCPRVSFQIASYLYVITDTKAAPPSPSCHSRLNIASSILQYVNYRNNIIKTHRKLMEILNIYFRAVQVAYLPVL